MVCKGFFSIFSVFPWILRVVQGFGVYLQGFGVYLSLCVFAKILCYFYGCVRISKDLLTERYCVYLHGFCVDFVSTSMDFVSF